MNGKIAYEMVGDITSYDVCLFYFCCVQRLCIFTIEYEPSPWLYFCDQ